MVMVPTLTFVDFNSGSRRMQRMKGILFSILYPIFFWICVIVVKPVSYYTYTPLYNWLASGAMTRKNAIEMTKKFVTTLKRLLSNTELLAGDALPEGLVVYTVDSKRTTLSKVIDPNKLTVLNFGSCTCPIYMGHSAKFYELTAKYKDDANIAFVSCYVPEAHPIDEWKIESNKRELIQQKSMKERVIALKYLIEDVEEKVNEKSQEKWNADNIIWIADNIEEPNLDYYFNARPIRMVIVKGNRVVYKDGYGPWFYNVNAIRKYLNKFSGTQQD